jgi:hypothetical protein
MKVIITGSTGMIGKGVLLECLASDLVAEVLLINRSPIDIKHPKIKELLSKDWLSITPGSEKLKGYDACFFCMGATLTTPSEAKFRKINYDITLHLANIIHAQNPKLSLCYVSGMGIDGTKPSKSMFMRIKGEVEQALLSLPLKHAYMFRPGYIQPMKGVTSKTWPYRLFYMCFSPFYGLIKKCLPRYVTSTVQIGKAMINVVNDNHPTPFLENEDINRVSKIF